MFVFTVPFLPPWRIGTLSTLLSKLKSVQAGLSGSKLGQTGQNGAKWCQTESNVAKRGHKGPYLAKRGQKGQTGPNDAKWGRMGLIFACTYIFIRLKNHV